MNNAVSRQSLKQCVCWVRWPAISSFFGRWAAHRRSYTIYKGCVQAMWNGDVTTARILLETKGKATEQWCSLQRTIQTEKEKETKKYILHNLKQSNKKGKTTNQVRLTALVWRSQKGMRQQEKSTWFFWRQTAFLYWYMYNQWWSAEGTSANKKYHAYRIKGIVC